MIISNTSVELDNLTKDYTERLLDIVNKTENRLPRTYGFEYEFLPDRILDEDDMLLLYNHLSNLGYSSENGVFSKGERKIAFEPGGQIEYLSPPMTAFDTEEFDRTTEWISETNGSIRSELGITYVGTDFMPGRYSAPLLLTSDRYSRMHSRFLEVDTRGPDMMKGTAAIHMHAAIVTERDIELLYPLFCRMAQSCEFGMSENRREIWNRTDKCRCGLPDIDPGSSAVEILQGIVRSTLEADEIRSGNKFYGTGNRDFSDFLDHMTTMFTDIRLNVKGVTLELRTPDSRPLEEFPAVWMSFMDECEAV